MIYIERVTQMPKEKINSKTASGSSEISRVRFICVRNRTHTKKLLHFKTKMAQKVQLKSHNTVRSAATAIRDAPVPIPNDKIIL